MKPLCYLCRNGGCGLIVNNYGMSQLFYNSMNALYLASCNKCSLQYVGSTTTSFKVRFRNHKSHMKNNKRTCEVATFFNSNPYNLKIFNLYAYTYIFLSVLIFQNQCKPCIPLHQPLVQSISTVPFNNKLEPLLDNI